MTAEFWFALGAVVFLALLGLVLLGEARDSDGPEPEQADQRPPVDAARLNRGGTVRR